MRRLTTIAFVMALLLMASLGLCQAWEVYFRLHQTMMMTEPKYVKLMKIITFLKDKKLLNLIVASCHAIKDERNVVTIQKQNLKSRFCFFFTFLLHSI